MFQIDSVQANSTSVGFHAAWTYRTFVLLLFLLGLHISIGCSTKNQTEKDRLPNIIYIMADDLGYGDIGSYEQAIIQTPRLDRLAEEGMRFTNHYAGHTVCRCSRLSLWTGYHTGHLPIQGNAKYTLEPQAITVAKLLKQKGYVTGGVGKWSLGDTSSLGHPNKQGFDFWMGYLDQSDAHNYYPTHLWRNYEVVPLAGNVLSDNPEDRGRVATQKETYAHDLITEEALAFIRRNAEKPFLLHIHWTLPHANNEAGRATGDGMEIPDYGIYAKREWPAQEKGFAAMVSRLDGDVGRIVDLLDELNLRQNTLVIFTSDNGPHEEGGHQHEFFNSNGALRGLKRDLYEGGIRVPFIAVWPGHIQEKSTSDYPSAFWDYLPTACEIAGVDYPKNLDGISYLPALLGKQQKEHDYLYWEYEEQGRHKAAVRAGNWKAVLPGTKEPVELYDLSVDSQEQNNLAAKQPEILAGMVKIIEEMK
ncbi:MAG: arylsulfatase [Deferribacteres bacterium]|nr:arylsulfatase [candidate division KSB1 bacterium]MCB9501576.1 arylsulfatase [Deferribacteres bacterium]